MTLPTMKGTVMTFIIMAALCTFSCKGKEKDKNIDATDTTNMGRNVTPDTSTSPVTTAPETITADQLKDATKDFPGVTATADNGEVTLTGTISREKLPKLMQSVQALNPKKVNNNLTVK